MRKFLAKKLKYKQKKKLRDFYADFRAIPHGSDLSKLGEIYKTDKFDPHNYLRHYQIHFERFRNRRIVFLEIGVGGYSNPLLGGESLRMWKRYFPNAKIYSLDIYDKSFHEEGRVKIFRGSQVDHAFLDKVLNEIGSPDIIVDDGSHINEHIIGSFEYLFPHLKKDGIYAIEDLQTSYWDDGNHGGDSIDLNNEKTAMGYFKTLVNGLNYPELVKPGYEPTYLDKNITSLHFYHNLAFIYKGDNDKWSNRVVSNEKIITPNEMKELRRKSAIENK